MELRIYNDTAKPQYIERDGETVTILPGETKAFPVATIMPSEWEIPVMDEYRPFMSIRGNTARWVQKEAGK